jgi:FKBP-type peptidyl-prolyl cis-trans isomerase
MARTRDRVIAIIIAGLFFVFSFGFSFVVIWQLVNDNKDSKPADSKTSISGDDQKIKQEEGKKDMLEGKNLADFSPIAKIDALDKIDTIEGTGDEAKAGDTVTVDYTGAVAATGIVFQSSLDSGQKATFPLGNVIKGWQDGIPGMKVGGTRRLLIPADQAYGASPPQGSNIPANADLVFDVTLHKIGQ